MLVEYIDAALKRAHYDIIEDDEPYYGEIRELQGVWAVGSSLEECRENLKDVVEGWLLISIKHNKPVPELGNVKFHELEDVAA